jgi:coenzyme F420-reducing hydrogenase alpha subunit
MARRSHHKQGASEDDFPGEEPSTEPEAPGGHSGPIDEDESTRMLARIRELETKLGHKEREVELLSAERRAKGLAPLAASADEPKSVYWTIRLLDAPTHTVKAKDRANAWEVYKEELGVIGSQNQPEITPGDIEDYRRSQAKRYGARPDEWKLPEDDEKNEPRTESRTEAGARDEVVTGP